MNTEQPTPVNRPLIDLKRTITADLALLPRHVAIQHMIEMQDMIRRDPEHEFSILADQEAEILIDVIKWGVL